MQRTYENYKELEGHIGTIQKTIHRFIHVLEDYIYEGREDDEHFVHEHRNKDELQYGLNKNITEILEYLHKIVKLLSINNYKNMIF